ncbi:MAG: LicD family protein [archaeon]|nr:LicD family protein [archaeon]
MDGSLKAVVDGLLSEKDYKGILSLAEDYRKGKDVKKSMDTAIELDRAACTVSPDAYVALYDDLRKRHGREDIDEAVSIVFTSPCNNADMILRRASAYLFGYGIERNLDAGFQLLRTIIPKSERYAIKFIEAVLALKIPALYKEAFQVCTSMKWKERGPLLAKMYSKGIGTGKDLGKAATLYAKYGKTEDAADCYMEAGDLEKALEALGEKSSSKRDIVLARIAYSDGDMESAIDHMGSAARSVRPWAEEDMTRIVDLKDDDEWRYDVYSVFSDCADKKTCLEVLRHYPEDLGRKDQQTVELALLNALNGYCDELDIEPLIDGGNLLGIVRHGNFVPWDDDIDVRMFVDDIEKMKRFLSENDRDHYIMDSYVYGGYYKFYSILHGGWIDIFPLESLVYRDGIAQAVGHRVMSEDDPSIEKVLYRVRRDSQPVACKSYFTEKELFPLSKTELCGVSVNIPNDPEAVLTSFYGRWYMLPSEPKGHVGDTVARWNIEAYRRSTGVTDRKRYILKVAERYREAGDAESAKTWETKAEKGTPVETTGADTDESIALVNSLVKAGTEDSLKRSFEILQTLPEEVAAIYIGRAYYKGYGVKKSKTKAAEYLRKAKRPVKYEQMFFDVLWSIGTKESLEEMVVSAETALKRNPNSVWLKARLGKAYYLGKGVEKDWERAEKLLSGTETRVSWAGKILDKIRYDKECR